MQHTSNKQQHQQQQQQQQQYGQLHHAVTYQTTLSAPVGASPPPMHVMRPSTGGADTARCLFTFPTLRKVHVQPMKRAAKGLTSPEHTAPPANITRGCGPFRRLHTDVCVASTYYSHCSWQHFTVSLPPKPSLVQVQRMKPLPRASQVQDRQHHQLAARRGSVPASRCFPTSHAQPPSGRNPSHMLLVREWTLPQDTSHAAQTTEPAVTAMVRRLHRYV